MIVSNGMKIAELKTKDTHELEELLKEFKIKLGRLVFERERKTLKKSSDLGITKRNIARINTLLHDRHQ